MFTELRIHASLSSTGVTLSVFKVEGSNADLKQKAGKRHRC